jgi:hypothetical protein
LIGAFVGLTDEQFNRETAPDQWTYRVVAKHVLTLEQDSPRSIAADRQPGRAAPDTLRSAGSPETRALQPARLAASVGGTNTHA